MSELELTDTDRRLPVDGSLHFTYSLEHEHELTGLPNRTALQEAMENAVRDPQLQGNFGVIFIDLDGLKEYNDTEGHGEGDKYLRYAAGALRDSTRKGDMVAIHLSGDEFAILIAGVREEEVLGHIQNRIQEDLDEIGVAGSMGGVVHKIGETPSQLLSTADKRMYENKIKRKLEGLSPEQQEAFMRIGEIASEHGLSMRDAPAIIIALGENA